MLSLSLSGVLTMSQLAAKINTSNEQATRAVAQLVDKGFIIRMQNPRNRRVINIKLTEEANVFLEKMKNDIIDELVTKFSALTDDEMKTLYESVVNVSTILKKVLD